MKDKVERAMDRCCFQVGGVVAWMRGMVAWMRGMVAWMRRMVAWMRGMVAWMRGMVAWLRRRGGCRGYAGCVGLGMEICRSRMEAG